MVEQNPILKLILFQKNRLIKTYYILVMEWQVKFQTHQGVDFYYRQCGYKSLAAFRKVSDIKGLKNKRYYNWIMSQQIVEQYMNMISKIVNLSMVDNVKECIKILQDKNKKFEEQGGIICNDLKLVKLIGQRYKDFQFVKEVLYFSFRDTQTDIEADQEKFNKLKDEGIINEKFIFCEGFAGLRRKLQADILLPNCIMVNNQQQLSRLERFNLYILLNQQFDREIMVTKMIELLEANIKKDNEIDQQQFQLYKNKQREQLKELKELLSSRNYKPLNYQQVIELYTKQSFLYHKMSHMFKKTHDPLELIYFQPLIKDLFEAIKTKYKSSSKYSFQCYRGAKFSEEQIEKMKASEGKCMECLGFLSTSLSKEVANRFTDNVFITIRVDKKPRSSKTDYGYASIKDASKMEQQKQVLFNPLNSFKIISVKKRQNQEVTDIKLSYGAIPELEYKFERAKCYKNNRKYCLDENQSELLRVLNERDYHLDVEEIKKFNGISQGMAIYMKDTYDIQMNIKNIRHSYYYHKILYKLFERTKSTAFHQYLQIQSRFSSLVMMGKIRLQEDNNEQVQQIIQRCEEQKQYLKKSAPSQIIEAYEIDLYHLKIYYFLNIQKYQIVMKLIEEGQQMLKKFEVYAKNKYNLEFLRFQMKKYQCLAKWGKTQQASQLLKQTTTFYEKQRDANPELYYSIKNYQKKMNFHYEKDPSKKLQKMNYLFSRFNYGKDSQLNLQSVMKVEFERLKNFSNHFNNKNQNQLNREQYAPLKLNRLIFLLVNMEKKQHGNNNFLDLFSELLAEVQNFPQKYKNQQMYSKSLKIISDIYFQLGEYTDSLSFAENNLKLKQKYLINIVDNQFICMLERLCELYIGLRKTKESIQIREKIQNIQFSQKQQKRILTKFQLLIQLRTCLNFHSIQNSEVTKIFEKYKRIIRIEEFQKCFDFIQKIRVYDKVRMQRLAQISQNLTQSKYQNSIELLKQNIKELEQKNDQYKQKCEIKKEMSQKKEQENKIEKEKENNQNNQLQTLQKVVNNYMMGLSLLYMGKFEQAYEYYDKCRTYLTQSCLSEVPQYIQIYQQIKEDMEEILRMIKIQKQAQETISRQEQEQQYRLRLKLGQQIYDFEEEVKNTAEKGQSSISTSLNTANQSEKEQEQSNIVKAVNKILIREQKAEQKTNLDNIHCECTLF